MEIKIEKGITIPRSSGVGRAIKYPFKHMEIGDSFFVNGGTKHGAIRQSAYNARIPGAKFTIRKEAAGYRVWRIK
jgi:hypothetical protein